MIENIRKFKGLIIVGIALVAFALIIGIKDDIFKRSGAGKPLFEVNGRTYNDVEYTTLGLRSYELTVGLAQSGEYSLFSFIQAMGGGMRSDEAPEQFFVNRMILWQAKEQYGTLPSDDEVSNRIRTMKAFAGENGEFNSETYENFVERYLGRLSLTERHLRELVSDFIAFEKLTQIVGSGLSYDTDIAARNAAFDNQEISGHIARYDLEPIKATIKPTDEEIKTYWETVQDAFMTAATRKYQYVLVSPEIPEKTTLPPVEDSLANLTATDAAKQEAQKKREQEQAEIDSKHAELVRKKQLEVDTLVDDFTYTLEEAKGEGFEQLAEKNKWKVITTEQFSMDAPPQDLMLPLRSSSRGGNVVSELFKMQITSDPLSVISQPIPCGTHDWIVAKYIDEVPSRRKTFDEAKDEARARYIDEKAAEQLKKLAEESLEKIKTAVAEGKSFDEAAKANGAQETQNFSKVGKTYRPNPATEPGNLFQATRTVDPEAFTDVNVQGEHAFIIQVTKREIIKSEDIENQIKSDTERNNGMLGLMTFTSWLDQRKSAANVKYLFKRN